MGLTLTQAVRQLKRHVPADVAISIMQDCWWYIGSDKPNPIQWTFYRSDRSAFTRAETLPELMKKVRNDNSSVGTRK